MVLLIIIPFLDGYFIGNIPNIFRQTHIETVTDKWNNNIGRASCATPLNPLSRSRVPGQHGYHTRGHMLNHGKMFDAPVNQYKAMDQPDRKENLDCADSSEIQVTQLTWK